MDAAPRDADAADPDADRPAARRRVPLGSIALALGAVTFAALATGLTLVSGSQLLAATVVAWIGTVAGGLAVVVGIAALIRRSRPGAAVAGIVLGIVTNPPVLSAALNLIGATS